ncbi:MAG: glycosyltransferase family 2 protein [Paludibacter sp.]|jgi:dolichol-phosphate mannosyltransferase|nr:glycosyltransferase family 2 protein [Paludibacter sp.]
MKISIIISVFNEESVLPLFYKEITAVLNTRDYELIFVNDGSTDGSQSILDKFSADNKRVKTILFSRNFGHEAAMIAGIDLANGDAVICMDADLQHPPAAIEQMLECFQNQKADVIMMIRDNAKKSVFSSLFYKLLNTVSEYRFEPNASDFFLISRVVAELLRNNYRERVRFLRGFIQIIGFRKISLTYTANARSAGKSKYSTDKLISLSVTAIATLSKMPLKISIYAGVLSGAFSVLLTIYSIVMKIIQQPISGYTTIVVFLGVMFSILFLILGVLGQYIGFLFDEQKARPIYIIDKTTNI